MTVKTVAAAPGRDERLAGADPGTGGEHGDDPLQRQREPRRDRPDLPHRSARRPAAGQELPRRRGTATRAVWNGKIDGRPRPPGRTWSGSTSPTPRATPATSRRASRRRPGRPRTPASRSATSPRSRRSTRSRPGPARPSRCDSPASPYRWTLARSGARKPLASGRVRPGDAVACTLPAGRAGLYKLVAPLGGRHDHRADRRQRRRRPTRRGPGRAAGAHLAGTEPGRRRRRRAPEHARDRRSDRARPPARRRPARRARRRGGAARLPRRGPAAVRPDDRPRADRGRRAARWTGHAASCSPAASVAARRRALAALRAYVQPAGNVLSLGVDSLRRRGVTVAGEPRRLHPTAAASPTRSAPASALVVARPRHRSTLTIADGLGIFTATPAPSAGFRTYQPIIVGRGARQGRVLGGADRDRAAIVGYSLGDGIVVDVGVPGFGSALAHNVDAQELIDQLWSVVLDSDNVLAIDWALTGRCRRMRGGAHAARSGDGAGISNCTAGQLTIRVVELRGRERPPVLAARVPEPRGDVQPARLRPGWCCSLATARPITEGFKRETGGSRRRTVILERGKQRVRRVHRTRRAAPAPAGRFQRVPREHRSCPGASSAGSCSTRCPGTTAARSSCAPGRERI